MLYKENCPEELHAMAVACAACDPSERPSVQRCVEELDLCLLGISAGDPSSILQPVEVDASTSLVEAASLLSVNEDEFNVRLCIWCLWIMLCCNV